MRRILFTGDRDWDDRVLFDILCLLYYRDADFFIEGDARGLDKMAGKWADANAIPLLVFPANWTKFKRAAGPIRNRQMLKEGKPTEVAAFHDNITESRGTKDMISASIKAGLKVTLYSHSGLCYSAPENVKPAGTLFSPIRWFEEICNGGQDTPA